MVSFEVMIKRSELRHVLMKFLENTHAFLKTNGIIDMDEFQKKVYE
jgi:hypothetical protein